MLACAYTAFPFCVSRVFVYSPAELALAARAALVRTTLTVLQHGAGGGGGGEGGGKGESGGGGLAPPPQLQHIVSESKWVS